MSCDCLRQACGSVIQNFTGYFCNDGTLVLINGCQNSWYVQFWVVFAAVATALVLGFLMGYISTLKSEK